MSFFTNEKDEPLDFPSTRLGVETRRTEYSLRPARPQTPNSKDSPKPHAHATLRKSFRKTLPAVSGLDVRMRNFFVPHVMFPGEDDGLKEDALVAGHTERTIVLSIELDNPAESRTAFMVEGIDVIIGADKSGARVRLISWGGSTTSPFPLCIGPREQYNVLYAVELLSTPLPEADELLGPNGGISSTDLPRGVTIHVLGPYELRRR